MINLIALMLVLAGVVFVYDARILSDRWFGFGDQNEATARIENFRFYICYNRGTNFVFLGNQLDRFFLAPCTFGTGSFWYSHTLKTTMVYTRT